ncbi:MAG: hypothetical protein ACRD2Y_08090 [Terriglobales bacterium]
MSSVTASPIEIRTSPEEVPSIPPWFAEVVVLARYFTQQGYLDAISQRVRLARGRAGTFDVLDFVAILLGYAVSGEPTLEAFFDRLAPFAHPFMALFGRDQLPHRATLSRFLADIDSPCRDALRQVFQDDLLEHGCVDEQMGGFLDCLGQHMVVFDVDGTRQAARQRALAMSPDLPAAQRRMDMVCAPGYLGRKRGEVVRTRTTVLQAHTQEWLGTFSNSGNGEYALELEAACYVITAYLAARTMQPSQALIRLDGLYGTIGLLARIQPFKLGFLTRGRDYQLLDHPAVQARLLQPCDLTVTHLESQVQRELFDVGFIADWLPERPEVVIPYRVLVTRRTAPADLTQIAVGKLRDNHVYELFLTSHPASSLPAATVLELYQHRGSFEQVLSDEDVEQDPDRWCSRTPCGQEFWQILNHWVWNVRLRLGSAAQPQPLRWTTWEAAGAASCGSGPTGAAPASVVEEPASDAASPMSILAPQFPAADDLVPTYGPLALSQPWAKARRRFSAQDFTLNEDDTLTCPAGKALRPRERRTLPNGDLRVLYAAKVHDCRTCAQAGACLGQGASGEQPRRVSGVRRVVGWQVQAALVGEQPTKPPVEQQQDAREVRVLQWGDLGGRRVRRDLVARLRRQQVTITDLGVEPAPEAEPRICSRAERAHRRWSWANRLARNACGAATPRWTVMIPGIWPVLAAYLDLPSVPAG